MPFSATSGYFAKVTDTLNHFLERDREQKILLAVYESKL